MLDWMSGLQELIHAQILQINAEDGHRRLDFDSRRYSQTMKMPQGMVGLAVKPAYFSK